MSVYEQTRSRLRCDSCGITYWWNGSDADDIRAIATSDDWLSTPEGDFCDLCEPPSNDSKRSDR